MFTSSRLSPLVEEWAFHGTVKESVLNIATQGFKVGGKDGIPARNGSQYGFGVYTAVAPTKPMTFMNFDK